MNPKILKERTKQFGLRVLNLYEEISKTKKGEILGNQLLRSGTSVGANYRAHAEQNQMQILFIKFRLLKRKQMNQCIGSS